tara:strand:+ start:169 stop:462 length:294 start_codon:yes stop_codon:yes gene_type:complete
MKLDSQQKKIVQELSHKHNLTESQVIEIIDLPFKFIRKEITKIEFTGEETQEEFESKGKNFNIPAIGKLYANYYNFKYVNNARRIKQKKNESGDKDS